VTPERFDLPAELLDWLRRDDHPATGWADPLPYEQMRCHPDLAELVETLARQVGGVTRVWVAGRPVLHVGGQPIAYATGTDVFAVRSDEPAGALAPRFVANDLDGPWVHLDPYAPDVTFTTTRQLLTAQVQHARDRAEAGVWP
jgi:hypothetical protein